MGRDRPGQRDDLQRGGRAEAELRVAAVAFESQEAMLVADAQHNILRVNSACCRITGYRADELIGRRPDLFQFRRDDGSVAPHRLATSKRATSGAANSRRCARRHSGPALAQRTAVRSQQAS